MHQKIIVLFTEGELGDDWSGGSEWFTHSILIDSRHSKLVLLPSLQVVNRTRRRYTTTITTTRARRHDVTI